MSSQNDAILVLIKSHLGSPRISWQLLDIQPCGKLKHLDQGMKLQVWCRNDFEQLFKHQEEYFDAPSQDLTIRQIREKLAQLASEVLPANTIEQFKELLTVIGSGNGGTGVTDDLKYNGLEFQEPFS